jgi:hypothetical protein
VGSALGLAAITIVSNAHGADRIGNVISLTNGYSAAFLGAAVIAVGGGALALLTVAAGHTSKLLQRLPPQTNPPS